MPAPDCVLPSAGSAGAGGQVLMDQLPKLEPSAASGKNGSRYLWLYLLRPANPFDSSSPLVAVDSVRFAFLAGGGTVTTDRKRAAIRSPRALTQSIRYSEFSRSAADSSSRQLPERHHTRRRMRMGSPSNYRPPVAAALARSAVTAKKTSLSRSLIRSASLTSRRRQIGTTSRSWTATSPASLSCCSCRGVRRGCSPRSSSSSRPRFRSRRRVRRS